MKERLLTLTEVSKRIGIASSRLQQLVYQHPPILDIELIGRAPRFRASQIISIRKSLLGFAVELIERDPKLLGMALGIAKAEDGEHWAAPDEAAVCEMIRDLNQIFFEKTPSELPVEHDFEGEFA